MSFFRCRSDHGFMMGMKLRVVSDGEIRRVECFRYLSQGQNFPSFRVVFRAWNCLLRDSRKGTS